VATASCPAAATSRPCVIGLLFWEPGTAGALGGR
jgi:hypothetical protein